MKKIGLIDVKFALKDSRFRETLPESMYQDLTNYLQNPTCPCNLKFYKRVITEAKEQLLNYFHGGTIEEIISESENKKIWEVINCNIEELESKLKSTPPGKKQLAIARYEDQVTVIICDLDP